MPEIKTEVAYRALTEQEQKQVCFDVTSRCNYHPEFYGELLELIARYEEPFDSTYGVQRLKPEFRET